MNQNLSETDNLTDHLMKIEFLYFDGCPHHEKAFDQLQEVLRDSSIDASIERIEIKDDEGAARHKFVGSPTIRVDGVDIDAVTGNPVYAKTCRVYKVDGKLTGLPSPKMIEDAVWAADFAKHKRGCC